MTGHEGLMHRETGRDRPGRGRVIQRGDDLTGPAGARFKRRATGPCTGRALLDDHFGDAIAIDIEAAAEVSVRPIL